MPEIRVIAPGRTYRVDSDATIRRCSTSAKACGWART